MSASLVGSEMCIRDRGLSVEQHRCNSAENCRELLETGSYRFLQFPAVSCAASLLSLIHI
eukprot:7736716-Alexandrium_andersonii.AAC.1